MKNTKKALLIKSDWGIEHFSSDFKTKGCETLNDRRKQFHNGYIASLKYMLIPETKLQHIDNFIADNFKDADDWDYNHLETADKRLILQRMLEDVWDENFEHIWDEKYGTQVL